MLPWNPPAGFLGSQQGQQGPATGQMEGLPMPSNSHSQMGGLPSAQQQQGGPPPAPPLPGSTQPTPITLSQVLHFLQTEYRRHEREKNEWEIERGEMRARIALLEGEKRGSENVRADLMRRVRMLEFALRGERSKYLSMQGGAPKEATVAAKVGALAKSEEGSGSPTGPGATSESGEETGGIPGPSMQLTAIPPHLNLSRPPSSASMNPSNGPNGPSDKPFEKSNTLPLTGIAAAAASGTWNPAIGRDPKGRARSRDYLKQCLQEITYLTSTATMNPLPDRTANGLPRPPKKVAPAIQIPSSVGVLPPSQAPLDLAVPASVEVAPMAPESAALPPPNEVSGESSEGPPTSVETAAAVPLPEEPAFPTEQPPLPNGTAHEPIALDDRSTEERVQTAIFRPESAEAWRAQLRAAGQKAGSIVSDTDSELGSISMSSESEDEENSRSSTIKKSANEGLTTIGEHKLWKSKKVLRSHLDAVRALAFDRTDVTLVSGGDDLTVKVWRLNLPTLAQNGSRTSSTPEVEPQITLRGHSAPITALAISSSQGRIYSASLDQTVQVWQLPPRDRELYAPFDSTLRSTQLEGHTDAIWDLALLPHRIRDEQILATASADGSVKVWSVDDTPGGQSLKASWYYGGMDSIKNVGEPRPTSLDVCHADLRKLLVSYSNSVVKIFDLESGKEVLKLKSCETFDGTPATQINKVITHPTLPIAVTAHEDRFIRIFDLNSGLCTHSMLAHLDAVTSIDLDPSGLTLVSGGHDCSVRFWDLLSTRSCVQEISSHRVKGGEGVLEVRYHPSLPFLASSGADGVVKIYSSTSG